MSHVTRPRSKNTEMRLQWIATFALMTAFLGVPLRAAPLRAGAAKVDITPPPGVKMWGYARRAGPAAGTLDPLYGRVLALEADGHRIAIATVDLGRSFGPASLARLRESAKLCCNTVYVFLAATHTHSGPVIQDEYPTGKTPDWEIKAVDKLAAAIKEANGRLQDARAGSGYGVAYIGHNRLRHNSDGSVSWFERNPTRTPTSPFDPTVSVLRFDSTDGKPVAIMVNYACHPVVLGPDNLKYSADFPADTTETVERIFPNAPLCLFLQGAPGDINPIHAATPFAQDALQAREWTGKELGKEAARVAQSIQTTATPSGTLDFAEDAITFHLRWERAAFRKSLIDVFGPAAFEEFGPSIREEMQIPVSTILINKQLAILGMAGEPFVNFQIDWRVRCPVPHAILAGYANGYFGYFPTIPATTWKAYGASTATTWVEPGAGERMVEHGLIKIYEMLGRLTRHPRDAEF
jgi:neutral ceramidase